MSSSEEVSGKTYINTVADHFEFFSSSQKIIKNNLEAAEEIIQNELPNHLFNTEEYPSN